MTNTEKLKNNKDSFLEGISGSLNDLMKDITDKINDILIKLGLKKQKEIEETENKTIEELNKLKDSILNLNDEKDINLTQKEKEIREEIEQNKDIKNYISALQETKSQKSIFNENVINKEKTNIIYSIKSEINEDDTKITESELNNIIKDMPDMTNIKKDEKLVSIINNINGKYTISEIKKAYDEIKSDIDKGAKTLLNYGTIIAKIEQTNN